MLTSLSKAVIIGLVIAALPFAAWATPVKNRSTQPVKYVADYDMATQTLTILTWDAAVGKISPLHSFDCGRANFKASLGMDAYLFIYIAFPKAIMIDDVVYVYGNLDEEPAIGIVDCNEPEPNMIYITLADIFAKIDDTELKADYERKGTLMQSQSQVCLGLSNDSQSTDSPVFNLYFGYADKIVRCSYDNQTGVINRVTTSSVPKEPKGTSVIVPDPSLENMIWQDKQSGRVYMYADSNTICYLNPGRMSSIQNAYIDDNYIVLMSVDTTIVYLKTAKSSTIITSADPNLNRPYIFGLSDDVLQILYFPYEWNGTDLPAYISKYKLAVE
jgi:hypothetical protein